MEVELGHGRAALFCAAFFMLLFHGTRLLRVLSLATLARMPSSVRAQAAAAARRASDVLGVPTRAAEGPVQRVRRVGGVLARAGEGEVRGVRWVGDMSHAGRSDSSSAF